MKKIRVVDACEVEKQLLQSVIDMQSTALGIASGRLTSKEASRQMEEIGKRIKVSGKLA